MSCSGVQGYETLTQTDSAWRSASILHFLAQWHWHRVPGSLTQLSCSQNFNENLLGVSLFCRVLPRCPTEHLSWVVLWHFSAHLCQTYWCFFSPAAFEKVLFWSVLFRQTLNGFFRILLIGFPGWPEECLIQLSFYNSIKNRTCNSKASGVEGECGSGELGRASGSWVLSCHWSQTEMFYSYSKLFCSWFLNRHIKNLL